MRGLLPRLGIVGVCGLALSVGVQAHASALNGGYGSPPVVLAPAAGALTYGYSQAVGSVVAGEPMALVGAGAGAYDGTCMVLNGVFNQTFSADCGSIGGAAQGLWNFVTSGSFAGQPSTYYTGPNAAIGAGDYAGPDAAFPLKLTTLVVPTGYWWSVRWSTTDGSKPFSNGNSSGCIATGIATPGQVYSAANGNDPNGLGATMGDTECSVAPGTQHIALQSAVFAYHGNWGACGQSGSDAVCWAPGVGSVSPWTQTFTETCTNTDGTTFTETVTGTFTPVAGQPSPQLSLPNCWDIQPGAVRTTVIGESGPQGAPPIETATQSTVDPGLATKYPNCVPPNRCTLTPYYVPTSTPCYTASSQTPAADCVDQWSGEGANQKDWQCLWGDYRVPMSWCTQAYPPPYFVGPGISSDPSGNPTVSPSPTPSTGPTVGPNVIPTNGTNPTTPTGTEGSNCWGAIWSWDPIDWVTVPVECALEWAFVPSQSALQTDIQSIQHAWDTSSPGQWLNALGSIVFPSLPTDYGCQGPSVNFTLHNYSTGNFYPLNACNGIVHTAATVTYDLLTAACVVGGAYACVRVLGNGVGYDPGTRGDV